MQSAIEYEKRARMRFQADCTSRRKQATRQNGQDILKAMRGDADKVARLVGWLLNGNYGYGACQQAWHVVNNTRMNKPAYLVQLIGLMEWGATEAQTRAAWKKLDTEQQAYLTSLVERTIEREIAERNEQG